MTTEPADRNESTVTGLGGTVRGRYEDDWALTIEGTMNREVRIGVGDVDMFVSAIDLQRVVNVATWTAEVDSWGHPDPAFLAIHPGLPDEAEAAKADGSTVWVVFDSDDTNPPGQVIATFSTQAEAQSHTRGPGDGGRP